MKNILLLYIGLFISGLNVAFAASGIYFNRLNVNHGLSSNEVTCIYKDKKGFMWFGINGELNRYDGYEFKSFKHRVNGIPYSEEVVSKSIETMDGNLWIT